MYAGRVFRRWAVAAKVEPGVDQSWMDVRLVVVVVLCLRLGLKLETTWRYGGGG